MPTTPWNNPPCPSCGKTEPVYKIKPEKGHGYFCWAKKGGCGHTWDPYVNAPSAAEEAPHPAARVEAGESLGQAVARVMETKPVVPAQVVIPPTALPAAVSAGVLPLGTVEVVTTMGTFTYPPRSGYTLLDGWLRIKRPDGAEVDVFNAVTVNRVRFHL